MKFDSDLIPEYVVITVILVLLGLFIYASVNEGREVESCFMQEPRTKECELVLYKYENRTKHTTTVMPIPVVVR